MRKHQIKLTESKILEAINDVLTDYENGEDGLYGSAREAVKNNTGFERWFSTKALPAGIDKEEALNLYTNAKRDLESLQYADPKYAYEKQNELPDFNQSVYDYDNDYKFGVWAQQDNSDGVINRAVGKSKRPTHRQTRSEIDKYFMDGSRFDLNETEIDKPKYYGYDIRKHIDNPSKEQIEIDNEWSRQNDFSASRNHGDVNDLLKYQGLRSFKDTSDEIDFRHNPKDTQWRYGDENRNVMDVGGTYSMMAMSDDPETAKYGKGERGTRNATFKALDDYLNETIHKVIEKFLSKH